MPVKSLPAHASLAHLKNQARDLRRAVKQSDQTALQRVHEFHPRASQLSLESLSQSDALLIIAREYGYPSWTKLKHHVEQRASLPEDLEDQIQDAEFRDALALLDAGRTADLRNLLVRQPSLVHRRVKFDGRNYFTNPLLIEFAAGNPIRRNLLPDNVVQVVELLLEGGSSPGEALALVASGSQVRERGVQCALIRLLCRHGADPSGAMLPALFHGEFESVFALEACGAAPSLAAAAARGDLNFCRTLFAASDEKQRHAAIALAAQFCRAEVVRFLISEKVSVNRFNPLGGHSHSTPLHQAAWAGCLQTVAALLDGGATQMRDALWNATPSEWAAHVGHMEIAHYLDLRIS